jgi:LPS-assembly protein
MPGRRFWNLAASLSLSVAAMAAETERTAAAAPAGPVLTGDFRSEEGGKVMVGTDAELVSGDTFLSAKSLRLDYRTGVIVAEGEVVYATKSLRILGAKVVIDPRADIIEATDVRFGRAPVYFTAESLRIVKGDKQLKGVRVWNNEPVAAGMHLKVAEASYVEKEDWLSLRSATPYVAGVPLFNLPYFGQSGTDFPYDVLLNTGKEDKQGRFLRTTVLNRISPSLWVGGLLDYYSESGFMVGPALRVDNTRLPEAGTRWKGRMQSGWIDDQSTLVPDLFGRLPDSQRAFFTGEINGRTRDGVEIAGNAFAQSDPDVLRDFRPFLIGQAGNPQLNLEVVKPYAGGYLSAALTAKADDYQDVVQRLPEFRYDLPTTLADDDGWSRRAFFSVGYFTERPSAELPLAAFQAATLSAEAWSTARIDGYYGYSRTMFAGDWLSFRPVAGVRASGWSEGLNGQDATTKAIGQAGFDLEGLFTGSWAAEAPNWGIDGLRHSLRPLLQYRVMPGADREIGVAPMTQRAVSVSVLEEVDLADRLDPASTTDRQVARFGVRNTVETRDAVTGSRELLRADLFADWRQGPTDAETGRSDLLASLRLSPTPWMTLSSSARLPNGGGGALESIQTIALNSGDFWRTSFNWVELRQATNARQLFWDTQTRLNSVYSVVTGLNYDAQLGQATLIWAGLIQRIGNSWEIEYGINKRMDPLNRDISSLGFHLRLRLFKF